MASINPTFAASTIGAEASMEFGRLDENTRLRILISLIRQKRHEEAVQLLQAFPFSGPFSANRTLFVEGLILRARGKPSKAIAKYRAALANDPSLSLVRAELAETLHEVGEDDSAKHHLKLLMGEAPDLAAAAGIKSFIDRIDDSRPYTVSAFVSAAPSTNINNGTTNDKVYVTNGVVSLPEQQSKKSGIGFSAGVNAGYTKRLNDDFSAVVSGGINARIYEDSEFNQFTASEAVELRYFYDAGYFGLGPVASQTSWGDEIDLGYWSLGPRASFSHQIDPQNRISASAILELRTYDQQSDNDGYAVLSDVSLSHSFGPGMVGFIGAGVDRVKADVDWLDYWSFSANLGLYKEWPWGITSNTQIEARIIDYDAPMRALPDARYDERITARVSLTKRDFNIWGYAPTIEYSYTLNESNIAYDFAYFGSLTPYDYDSHTVDVRLTKDF